MAHGRFAPCAGAPSEEPPWGTSKPEPMIGPRGGTDAPCRNRHHGRGCHRVCDRGMVIGAPARLLIPGRQNMSVVATIVLGVIAAVVGGLLWEALFPGNDGIAWIGSVIVAVLLLILYGQFFGRGTRDARPL